MNEESEGGDITSGSKRGEEYRIPGLEALAGKIAAASTNETLFCLAEEMDRLLADYLKRKGELPTSVELEGIIFQAARLIGDR